MSNQHAAMHLHNELQRQGRVGSLTWGDTSSGPEHKKVWTSTAYIGGVAYGTGTATTRQSARDEAAGEALRLLKQGN